MGRVCRCRRGQEGAASISSQAAPIASIRPAACPVACPALASELLQPSFFKSETVHYTRDTRKTRALFPSRQRTKVADAHAAVGQGGEDGQNAVQALQVDCVQAAADREGGLGQQAAQRLKQVAPLNPAGSQQVSDQQRK